MLTPMENDQEQLIEDLCVPTIFFDGLANVEARSGVMRMVAYVRKVDIKTGATVRVPVAVFMRPTENTKEIRSAIKSATAEAYLPEFAH